MPKGGKQARYRERRVAAGQCPHCGEPCAPYYECADRRDTKKLLRILNRLAAIRALRKEWAGYGHGTRWNLGDAPAAALPTYSSSAGDRRRLPRIGRRPLDDLGREIEAIVRAHGKPMGEQEIIRAYVSRRAAAVRLPKEEADAEVPSVPAALRRGDGED